MKPVEFSIYFFARVFSWQQPNVKPKLYDEKLIQIIFLRNIILLKGYYSMRWERQLKFWCNKSKYNKNITQSNSDSNYYSISVFCFINFHNIFLFLNFGIGDTLRILWMCTLCTFQKNRFSKNQSHRDFQDRWSRIWYPFCLKTIMKMQSENVNLSYETFRMKISTFRNTDFLLFFPIFLQSHF